MTTTPEQMREAAARLADIAAKTLAKNAPMISRDTGVNQMFSDLASAIRAIPIAPQPVAVTVKALVWMQTGTDRFSAKGEDYKVVTDGVGWAYCPENWPPFGGYPYHTNELAKAAAQVDYEARILSALTIHPADPLSDPRVKALVEALALAQYGLSWASAYFRDSNPPYCVDPCPPVNRGLDATRAALRAIGGEA